MISLLVFRIHGLLQLLLLAFFFLLSSFLPQPDPPVQALLGLCQCKELEDTAVEQLLSITPSPSEQV
jgi:hypothetical protein